MDHDEIYSGSREQLASCHEYERAHLDTNVTRASGTVYTPINIPARAARRLFLKTSYVRVYCAIGNCESELSASFLTIVELDCASYINCKL
jgi:hypothetical protein